MNASLSKGRLLRVSFDSINFSLNWKCSWKEGALRNRKKMQHQREMRSLVMAFFLGTRDRFKLNLKCATFLVISDRNTLCCGNVVLILMLGC